MRNGARRRTAKAMRSFGSRMMALSAEGYLSATLCVWERAREDYAAGVAASHLGVFARTEGMCPSGAFLIWLEVSVEAHETTWDLDETHVRRKRLRLDVLTTPCLRRVCNSSILNQSGLWQCPVTCPRCLPLLESHKCFIWIQICLQQHLPVKISRALPDWTTLLVARYCSRRQGAVLIMVNSLPSAFLGTIAGCLTWSVRHWWCW